MAFHKLPKKSLGQHWLKSVVALEAMCSESAVGPQDTIVEIGPGEGVLTKYLVERAKHVIAIELDQDLVALLPGRVPADNLEIVESDILSYDFSKLPADYKVVANIPYYLTNKLIRTLLETPNSPQLITLLIQKEVAERIATQPGALSVLAVSVQFYCEVKLGPLVLAKEFEPAPEVDSQIITLTRRETPLYDVDTKLFFRIVKAGFGEKRKKLINALSGGLAIPKPEATQLVLDCGLPEMVRAQELSLEQWYRLYQKVSHI